MSSAYEWGKKHGSCELEARRKFDIEYPGQGQASFYIKCRRGDWIIWQLGQTKLSEKLKKALQRALMKIAERAVRKCAANCNMPEFERWAEKWLSGEDRSIESAWVMAETIRTTSTAATTAIAESAAEAAAAAAAEEAGSAAEEAAKAAGIEASRVIKISGTSISDDGDLYESETSFIDPNEETREAIKKELKLQADDIRSEIPEWPEEECK